MEQQEYRSRQERVAQTLAAHNVDALLVTEPSNIAYLTGFTGDAGVALLLAPDCYLITDDRFATALATHPVAATTVITRTYLKDALEICARHNVITLGFESTCDYATFDYLDENSDAAIVAQTGVIEAARSVKSPSEIKHLQAAAAVAKDAYAYLLAHLDVNQSEWANAAMLDYYLKTHGAGLASFPTILASGVRSALPHATASAAKIAQNTVTTLDFGSFVAGYTFDVTRTFGVGTVSAQLKEIYAVVAQAKQAVIDHVRAGVAASELDAIGRKVIEQAGYGQYFNHGMGHGIGLSIHEAPYIGKTSTDTLVANQVITVEPGIYLPDVGGVRLEDDILVTATGARNLTAFGNDWVQLEI